MIEGPVFVEWIVRGESAPHPMYTALVVVRDEHGEIRPAWRRRLIEAIERELRERVADPGREERA